MKSEDTIFDHEKSSSNKKTWQEREVLDKGAAKKMTGKEAPVSENSSTARNAITSMGFGVLLGAASSLATNYAFAVGTNDSQDNLSENQMSGHYDWVEDGVDIATSVKDDMTFSDAFAAARAEVGAGGAFEWRGNVYATFYAEEWNSMTPEEKMEYNGKFHWSEYEPNDGVSGQQGVVGSEDVSQEAEVENVHGHSESGFTTESSSPEDLMEVEVEEDGDVLIPEVDDDEVVVLGVDDDSQILEMGDQEIHLIQVGDSGEVSYVAEDVPMDEEDLYADNSDSAYTNDIDYTQDTDGGCNMA